MPPLVVAAAPQTVPHPIEAVDVGVDVDSAPPTPTASSRSGLPKAVQSLMVGFGGMALLVGLVSAGLYGLSIFKSEGGATVPTLPPTSLFTRTPIGVVATLTLTSEPATMTSSPGPTNSPAPTNTLTAQPSPTASRTPSLTPTITLSPTPTLTLTPSNTPVPGPTAVPGVLPPPSGGDRLAFSSDRFGDDDIFLIDIDGTNLRQITTDRAADSNPAWSPNGLLIAFVSTRDGDAEIWVVAAGCPITPPSGCEGNMVQLTINTAREFNPAWSPNGQQIAYASNQDGDFEIWVMEANGSNPHPITSNTTDDFSPHWSPDGSQIVYQSQGGGASHLYRIPAAGGTPTQLTSSSAIDLFPDWSPDGNKIVYTSTSPVIAGARALFTLDLDSSAITQLLDGKNHDASPAWAPGGQRLAFASDRGGNGYFDLYILDLISSNVQLVTIGDDGNNVTPDWQPR